MVTKGKKLQSGQGIQVPRAEVKRVKMKVPTEDNKAHHQHHIHQKD